MVVVVVVVIVVVVVDDVVLAVSILPHLRPVTVDFRSCYRPWC